MCNLTIYHNGERSTIIILYEQIGKVLRLLPKDCEVKVYLDGTQLSNQLLGMSYPQIVDKFKHEGDQ